MSEKRRSKPSSKSSPRNHSKPSSDEKKEVEKKDGETKTDEEPKVEGEEVQNGETSKHHKDKGQDCVIRKRTSKEEYLRARKKREKQSKLKCGGPSVHLYAGPTGYMKQEESIKAKEEQTGQDNQDMPFCFVMNCMPPCCK